MYDEHRWFSLFFRRFVEFYNREICLLGYTFILYTYPNRLHFSNHGLFADNNVWVIKIIVLFIDR